MSEQAFTGGLGVLKEMGTIHKKDGEPKRGTKGSR